MSFIKTDETFDVQVWDEQVGCWFDLTEARTLHDADLKVRAYRKDAAAEGRTPRYRICETTYYEDAEIVLG